MDVIVYGTRSSALLLVPDCFLPSNEAQHRYGPLQPRGQVSLADGLRTEAWLKVAADIDRDAFALISKAAARQLLGSDHPYLQRPRRPTANAQA